MKRNAPASTITFTAATAAVWGDAFFMAREYLAAERKLAGDSLNLQRGEQLHQLHEMLDARTKAVVALARHLGGVPVAITIPREDGV